MNKASVWRSWVVILLVWTSVALILLGFVRMERGLDKRNTLQYLHDGSARAWTIADATLLGGSGSDTARAIARSENGDIYLLARADSNLLDAGEPEGDMDIFVFRLDGLTGEVLGDISIGGSGHDDGVAIAVEEDGDVLVTGTTTSDDFPAVRLQESDPPAGATSSFVVRFNPDLTAVRRNILLGGTGHIVVQDMLVDPRGDIYLAGSTSAMDFPTTQGAWRRTLADRASPMEVDYGADGFLMALDESLLNIEAATLFGGERDDYPYILRRTANGALVVAGNSASPDYPVTVKPEMPGGQVPLRSSVFVSVFNSSLTRLLGSAYWGSDTSDFLRGMALGDDGRVHICGHTNSGFFPVTPDAVTAGHSGGHYDMFYAVMSNDLTELVYSSYVGGGNNDFCHGAQSLDSGEVLIVGETNSAELLGNSGEYPGEVVRGSFLALVGPGRTDTVASLKAIDASIIYGTESAGEDVWLAGFTAASRGSQFAREQLATIPAGRDILYMHLNLPAQADSDGEAQ
jgi:hypothetical protein